MKNRFALLLLALLTGLSAFPAAADADAAAYAKALAEAKSDSLNPSTREWYVGTLRPAFSAHFRELVPACAQELQLQRLPAFGLVFTIAADGQVADLFWDARTDFSQCMERGLRARSFPRPPKDRFHFGLDVRPSS